MRDVRQVVGENIKKYRQLANLTQEDLAFNINSRPQTISGFENGHSYPSSTMIAKIAQGLGVPIACLFVIESEFNKLGNNNTVMVLGEAIKKMDKKKQRLAIKAVEFIANTDLD